MSEETKKCSICGEPMPADTGSCKKCGMTGKESAAYAIALHNRNPVIEPGESFEIEVYLTGYGVPKDNKLQIYYTTKGFIDPKNRGYIEVSGKPDVESGLFRFGDKYKTKVECGSVGEQIGLAKPFFRTISEFAFGEANTPDSHVPLLISETMMHSTPPILLHLNTVKGIKPGDYSVQFFLTYSSDKQDYKISEDEAHIHVTNWYERNVSLVNILVIIETAAVGIIG